MSKLVQWHSSRFLPNPIPTRKHRRPRSMLKKLDRNPANQENGRMKTTLELPDALVKQVKLRACDGRKLKDGCGLAERIGGCRGGTRLRAAAIVTDKETGLPVIQCKHAASEGEELTPERVADILLARKRAGTMALVDSNVGSRWPYPATNSTARHVPGLLRCPRVKGPTAATQQSFCGSYHGRRRAAGYRPYATKPRGPLMNDSVPTSVSVGRRAFRN